MNRKRILFATLLAVGVGALGLLSPFGLAPEEAQARSGATPLTVELRTLVLADGYTVAERFAGRVVPRRSSELGFERSGTLIGVHFDEGQPVAAGEILAELDVRALRAQRAEIDAQAAEVRAQLELARVTRERRTTLHAAGHLSSQRMDEAISSERSLVARLAAVRAAGERIDVALALSRIVAPYAGTIDRRHVDEGTVVAPGQPIVKLLEDGALEAHIGVPPATATRLETGARHEIVIDGHVVPATLSAVLESVAPDTRTVTAIFRIQGAPDGVRAGGLARVELPRRIESAGFWLPLSALTEGHRGLWSAYVVAADSHGLGTVERRQLEVLHAESDRAFVRGTLHGGETVVASGLHRLVPGLEVRVAVAPASRTASLP